MHGVTAQQLRYRLDRALEMLHKAAPSDLDKMTELWAIMSDMQLWIADREIEAAIRSDAAMRGVTLGKEL